MLKQLAYSLTISILIAGIFLAYMFLIGIPKTKARNYYNQGMIAREEGNEAEAQKNFEKALTYWDEEYIQREISNDKNSSSK